VLCGNSPPFMFLLFFRFARDQGRSIAFQNIALAMVFSFPYFSAKASYQLPIAWIAGSPVACIAAYTISPGSFQQIAKRSDQSVVPAPPSEHSWGSSRVSSTSMAS
jgi:hypothetical protein